MLQVGEIAKYFAGYTAAATSGDTAAAGSQRQFKGKWRDAKLVSPQAFLDLAK